MIRVSMTYCRVPLSICCTPKRDVTTSSLQLRKREHALHAGVVQLSGVLERGEGVNGIAIRNKKQFRSFINERSLDDEVPPVGPRLRAEACSLRLQTCHQAAVHTVRQQMHPAAKQLDDRNNTDERSPKASNTGLRDLPLKNIPSPNCGKCRLSTETKNLSSLCTADAPVNRRICRPQTFASHQKISHWYRNDTQFAQSPSNVAAKQCLRSPN